jgi:hypothetical protein
MVERAVKRKLAIDDSGQNLRGRRASLETGFCRTRIRGRNGRGLSAQWLLLAV